MTDSGDVLARLAQVLQSRKSANPETSYVARLLGKGPDAFLKKIGEEAVEVVMADFIILYSCSFFITIISQSIVQNSLITCLQTPQGNVKEFSLPTTAIFFIFFSPSYIALNIATRSAQIVGVYEAFSI